MSILNPVLLTEHATQKLPRALLLGTGICVDGACKGLSLTRVVLTVLEDDVCVTGVTLVEEEEILPDREKA